MELGKLDSHMQKKKKKERNYTTISQHSQKSAQNGLKI